MEPIDIAHVLADGLTIVAAAMSVIAAARLRRLPFVLIAVGLTLQALTQVLPQFIRLERPASYYVWLSMIIPAHIMLIAGFALVGLSRGYRTVMAKPD